MPVHSSLKIAKDSTKLCIFTVIPVQHCECLCNVWQGNTIERAKGSFTITCLPNELPSAVHAQVEVGLFPADSDLTPKGVSFHNKLGL